MKAPKYHQKNYIYSLIFILDTVDDYILVYSNYLNIYFYSNFYFLNFQGVDAITIIQKYDNFLYFYVGQGS